MKCPNCNHEFDIVQSSTIPDSLNNPRFVEKWNEWIRYRKENKWKFTPITQEKQLKMLSSQSNPVEILERSMQNGWQGLFEYKGANNGFGQNTGRHTEDSGKFGAAGFKS